MSIVITTNAAAVAQKLNLQGRELRNVLYDSMLDAAHYGRHDFERVTATWAHKPEIIETVSVRGTSAEAMVGTDDKIFGYVDQGTKPHIIRPRKAKALAFWSGFHPKTTPGSLQSGGGGSFGERIFAKWVRHPGIKARHFTKKIQQRLDKYTPSAVEKRMRQWAKRGR